MRSTTPSPSANSTSHCGGAGANTESIEMPMNSAGPSGDDTNAFALDLTRDLAL